MSRLIMLANRCAAEKTDAFDLLDDAINDILRKHPGVKMGWNGKINPGKKKRGYSQYQDNGSTFCSWDISPNEYDNYYHGYVHKTMWPIFHNRPDLAVYRKEYFITYKNYNQAVADMLAEQLCDEDAVWVLDYHHIAVGQRLKEDGYLNRCGFFFQQPFPPGDVFRSLPEHDWMIQALCHYDLIGFQSAADASHFISYLCRYYRTERLSDGIINVNGHLVSVGVFPCGIAGTRPEPKRASSALADYRRRIIISNDAVTDMSGIHYRLEAMRRFLNHWPQYMRDVSLLQISDPAQEYPHSSHDLHHKLERFCGELNGQYGDFSWYPVNYIHNDLCSRETMYSLYARAEVGMFTSLSEGMNLGAKAFVLAQNPENPGVLVLSQFSGTSQQLRDAVIVNPYDADETAQALHSALTMPLHERKRRHLKLLETLRRQDNHWWYQAFRTALEHPDSAVGAPRIAYHRVFAGRSLY
ncbi:alpha,alpha-trehalose-phosphate synthase (UDP-forming) [[Enterobacter] lignolyticus]|uniref:Alpha,alpha-trehalose-phosphate synthase n=1 Tax=[Enterobacter] lignolyticus TaxID=1334193 RepID=A0A806XF69_9ENTR|nr:trehalose-6-phosphate synthase [[Enterobacter] lignolyticus]ALR77361.1 alpha,alpha-trehalose-phosphate synthase [[Enterobacter] lignolyticus]